VQLNDLTGIFFTLLAYTLPLLVALSHFQEAGWKASPLAYAGLLAGLAAFAMTARVAQLLDKLVPEPGGGWWSKDELIALYLASLSALSLAVFLWVIPLIRENLLEASALLRSAMTGKRSEISGFSLSPTDEQVSTLGALWGAACRVLRAAAFIAFLSLYLVWPVFPLVMEQARDQNIRVEDVMDAARRLELERTLHRDALAVAARANSLIGAVLEKQGWCFRAQNVEACGQAYANQIRRIQHALTAFGVMPTAASVYDVEMIADHLKRARDKTERFNATLDQLAQKFRVKLPALALSPLPADGPAEAQKRIEERSANADATMARKLWDTVTSPEKILQTLVRDIGMAIALVIECVGMLFVFLIPSSRSGSS
jgi:hypothetical protein